ncbi:hypothetical protein KXV68_001027 [Aspergillus fumigatus]|nr:hypothetical protein KXX67_008140 [Aspergillus fumigatus]KAH2157775.1 hypothetical protein KXV68_001027 [Aspergillus fumigatus]KAH2469205.1 hypothetical protein KXW63_007958 [Aspergillus fumigatus]KAH2834425.1 hypothetical protein KXW76_003723 [Aspergillus fumigatus]KAH2998815.1 hypothetical protein KXV25_009218 [Aspergillus fumigatus]
MLTPLAATLTNPLTPDHPVAHFSAQPSPVKMETFKETLKETLYNLPKPPARTRTKPMQVICVGLPRSATESLAVALRQLGLTPYHGWDISFEENAGYIEGWAKLARAKWNGKEDGEFRVSRAEFDALLGHCDAVVDTAASFFAAELVEAYPEALVILNTRKDMDAWHRSAIKTLLEEIADRWFLWVMRLFCADLFWLWELFVTHGYPGLFRGKSARTAIAKNGRWVYREYCAMIRGLVAPQRLLEWSVEDGWEPLCEFLQKDVPPEAFPRTNDPTKFAGNVERVLKPRYMRAFRNLVLTVSSTVVLTTAIVLGVRGGGVSLNSIRDAGLFSL